MLNEGLSSFAKSVQIATVFRNHLLSHFIQLLPYLVAIQRKIEKKNTNYHIFNK